MEPHRKTEDSRYPVSCAVNGDPQVEWVTFLIGTPGGRRVHDALYGALFPVPWWRRLWRWLRRIAAFVAR